MSFAYRHAPWILLLCACGGGEPERPRPQGKPRAPVEVRLDAVDLGGGRHQVTLRATPTRDVDGVELRLRWPSEEAFQAFPATRAGEPRVLVRHLRGAEQGMDVVGDARVPVGAGWRNAAAIVRVGAAAPAAPPRSPRVVTLPGGTSVAVQP